MKKRTIKKELFYLFSMELTCAVGFWFVYAMWVWGEMAVWRAEVAYPLLILTVILVQGSLYWLNCLRRVKKRYDLKHSTNCTNLSGFQNG